MKRGMCFKRCAFQRRLSKCGCSERGCGPRGLQEKHPVAGLHPHPTPPQLLALNLAASPCSLQPRKQADGALSLQTTAWDLCPYFLLYPQHSAWDPRKFLLNYGTLVHRVLESVYSVFPQSVSDMTLGRGSVKAATTPTKYMALRKIFFGEQQCIVTY